MVVLSSTEGRSTMPRRNIQPRQAIAPAPQLKPEGKTWAEAYRPTLVNEEAGFEFGENKLANRLVFSFAVDPGEEVKARLKHYGYFYDLRQKAWTREATNSRSTTSLP
jgi:hypothetical protein